MKKLLILVPLLLFASAASLPAQTNKANLTHLTEEQYSSQIGECVKLAYEEVDVKNPATEVDDIAYDWVVETINKTIDKNFADKLSYGKKGDKEITYKVIYHKDKKDIYFGLEFRQGEEKLGETYMLYALMSGNGVHFPVKIHSWKKEVKKIFAEL